MSEELKPCPFCGGSDLTILPNEQDHSHVHCNDCMAKGPVVDQVADWTRPHTAWNRRAEQSDNAALRADVERLREAARDYIAAVGYAEGVSFTDDITNPESRAIIAALEAS